MRFLLLTFLFLSNLAAKDFDYNLQAVKISKDTYLVEGKKEYFSSKNGGDISNSSFIITKEGVIVIDTGSSYLYGKQLKELIQKITNRKIKYVINTHHHPDHFLGNQAFKNSEILSSAYTKEYIEKNGDEYIVNLINITLHAMKETEVLAPTRSIKKDYLILGKHKLKVLLVKGHTKHDLVLYDEYSKTLFASDIVFFNRAAATPHANIKHWIQTLKSFKTIPYEVLVPGHGEVSSTKEPLEQMISYLHYLDSSLKDAAKKGLSIFEILEQKKPEKFKKMSMLQDEFERSVINLYPSYEDKVK